MLRKMFLFVVTSFYGLYSVAQEIISDTAGSFEEFAFDPTDSSLGLSLTTTTAPHSGAGVYWTLGILAFTALAGIMVRYKTTYIFGRVYCGWICQLGTIQELIFKTPAFHFFQSEAAQKIMRTVRISLFFLLVVQLLITHTNLYRRIDPFVAIFNFYSGNSITWILVGLLVVSSVLMYRPFCKTVCPVGLALGWISKIPGASVLSVKPSCNSCLLCSKTCYLNAITHDGRYSVLDNQECIRCGNCLDSCKKDAVAFVRKSRQHHARIECKPTLPLPAAGQLPVA